MGDQEKPAGGAGTPDSENRGTGAKAADNRPQWTLKGVSPETRTAATKAAKRAGMTLGAWVDKTLREAAVIALKANPPPAATQDQMLDALAKLTERVEKLADAQGQRPHWTDFFRRKTRN